MIKIDQHITDSLDKLSPVYLQLIIRSIDKAEKLYTNEELFLCYADLLDYSSIMINQNKIGYTHKDSFGRPEPTIYINSKNKNKIFLSRNGRENHFVSITTFLKWVKKMNDYYAWPLPHTTNSMPMIKRIQQYHDRFSSGIDVRYTRGIKPTTMAIIRILKHYDETGMRKPIMVKDVSKFTQ